MILRRCGKIREKLQTRLPQNVVVLFLYILVIAAASFPILSNNMLYVSGDGVMGYLRKVFFVGGIRQNEFPLWNPYTSIGTPYLADIRQTTFSIFNLLFFIFEPTLAFNLTKIFQLVLGAYFMYLLVRQICENTIAAVLTGFVFSFSVMLGGTRVNHTSIIPSIAFFPVVFYFMEKFHRTSKESWIIGASITMALQFLCGFTQTVLYFDLCLFIYFLYIIFDNKIKILKAVSICVKWVGPYILMICIQVIPTAMLMLQCGREDIAYDYFSVYSFDLKILLMMITPYIYSNNAQAFDAYHSSGIDVEIYVGVILLTYLLYTIVFQFKKRQVKVLVFLVLGTFVFGMAGNVPYLGKIIYNIPILGSFRICARSLHLTIFFEILLSAIAFANFDKLSERKRMMKISAVIAVIVAACYIAIPCVLLQPQIYENIKPLYITRLRTGLLTAVVLCLLNCGSIFVANLIQEKGLLKRVLPKRNLNQERILSLILICIICINTIDVMRFSNKLDVQVKAVDTILDRKVSQEIDCMIADNTNNAYRTFVASKSLMYALMFDNTDYMYNSYLTFVDKKLKYWGLEETVSYVKMMQYLAEESPLISMLGIRYIVDAEKTSFFNAPSRFVPQEIVCENDKVDLVNLTSFRMAIEDAQWLEEDATYRITVILDGVKEKPEIFYADFCAEGYDNAEQDGGFVLNEDGKYETIISTQKIPRKDVSFRIITSPGNYKLSELCIEKGELEEKYEEIANDGTYTLYSVSAAQKIVYIPEQVRQIDHYSESWEDDELHDIDRISYVEGFGRNIEIDTVHSQVENIDIKRNSVSAVVRTEGETFVNHSQLAYPGWKAYVDGERVELYTVNNLIQGIIVPDGEHVIEFRYQPDDVVYGASLSLMGIVLTVLWFLWDKYRKKHGQSIG